MARELTRSLGATTLRVRLWTLKDKKSMFRGSYPDVHIVELTAKGEKHNVIIMEKQYEDYALAKNHYESVLRAFGLPLQYIKRKQSR